MAKKRSKKETEQMKGAFEKAKEQQKRLEEEFLFQKKLFPEGVLKPGDDRELHVLDFDMKQSRLEMAEAEWKRLAERDQANEEAKKAGSKTTRDKAIRKYNILKLIFEDLESKGEILPIKRTQIESVINPIWKKQTTIPPLKAKQLFDYQTLYLEGKQ